MGEEELQSAQNTEQAVSEEPSDSLDSLLSAGEQQEETSAEEPEDKEAKKQRDFEQGMKKFQTLAKEQRARIAELESQLSQKSAPEPQYQDLQNDPGVQMLEQIIARRVEAALSPITSATKEQQEAQVWQEFQQKDYVGALLPQIQEEYSNLPNKTGNLAQDLEIARLVTIGKYQSEIARASREVGQEEGYKARNLKLSGGLTGKATVPPSKNDFAQRYRNGQLSVEEMRDNWKRIEEIDREDRTKGL